MSYKKNISGYEYDIQRRLSYLGIGSIIAAPFTGGLSLFATVGIFAGKAGRYIRREFDEDFSKEYPLKRGPEKNYFKKIGNAIKNLFKGFKKDYTRNTKSKERTDTVSKLEKLC